MKKPQRKKLSQRVRRELKSMDGDLREFNEETAIAKKALQKELNRVLSLQPQRASDFD